MKIATVAFGLMLPLMLLAGACAPTTTTRTSTSPSQISTNTAAIKSDIANLSDRLRLAELRGGDSSADAAYLRSELRRLNESVYPVTGQEGQTLRQQLDYIAARLDHLEAQAAEREQYVDKMAEALPPEAPVEEEATPYQDSMTAPPPQSANAQSGQTSAYPTLPPTPSGPYEEGKTLFDKKSYGEAIGSFKNYLAAEPKGKNAAAAQFYIGESLYAQQKYEEAILEYQKVVQGFPKSSQVPTSLLKQGISFQSIGDPDSAKLLYQKVTRDYPKSYAAGVAKQRLTNLAK